MKGRACVRKNLGTPNSSLMHSPPKRRTSTLQQVHSLLSTFCVQGPGNTICEKDRQSHNLVLLSLVTSSYRICRIKQLDKATSQCLQATASEHTMCQAVGIAPAHYLSAHKPLSGSYHYPHFAGEEMNHLKGQGHVWQDLHFNLSSV